MARIALLTVALLVFAGCTGTPIGDTPTTTPTSTIGDTPTTTPTSTIGDTSTMTPTSTATPNPSDGTAQRRAIAAEKNRIRDGLADRENLTGLGFGIIRLPEAEVVGRNSTGAFVAVTVGYSFEIEHCGSVDGAATKTRYFVTTERTQLVAIEQDYTDRRSC